MADNVDTSIKTASARVDSVVARLKTFADVKACYDAALENANRIERGLTTSGPDWESVPSMVQTAKMQINQTIEMLKKDTRALKAPATDDDRKRAKLILKNVEMASIASGIANSWSWTSEIASAAVAAPMKIVTGAVEAAGSAAGTLTKSFLSAFWPFLLVGGVLVFAYFYFPREK